MNNTYINSNYANSNYINSNLTIKEEFRLTGTLRPEVISDLIELHEDNEDHSNKIRRFTGTIKEAMGYYPTEDFLEVLKDKLYKAFYTKPRKDRKSSEIVSDLLNGKPLSTAKESCSASSASKNNAELFKLMDYIDDLQKEVSNQGELGKENLKKILEL